MRILVSHLGASFLKLPLQGYHPAGSPHPPTVDCGVVAKAARTVAVQCWGPWRPMRFCCRPPSCPSSALIFISHQEKKMQKGKRSSTSMETAKRANEGSEERRETRLRDRRTEYKSKTDLVFNCLVCHGTMAALNPTPAILCDFSPLLSYSSQMHAFVLPVQW